MKKKHTDTYNYEDEIYGKDLAKRNTFLKHIKSFYPFPIRFYFAPWVV